MLTSLAIVVAGVLATVEAREDRAVFSQSIEVKRQSNAGKTYVRTVKATYVDINGDGIATCFNLRSKSPFAALAFVAGELPDEWPRLREKLGKANPGIRISNRGGRKVLAGNIDGMSMTQDVREHDNMESFFKVTKQFGRPALRKAEREAEVLVRNYRREQRDKGRSR
ncbi:hypothetical protein OAF82_00100 [bacterium]|nr:hypothetical protein [bacterium]